MKVTIKYCTPAMLSALTELKKGAPCPAPLRETLRARGWMHKDGTIAAKGLAYLNGRDMMAAQSTNQGGHHA
jgi:hypothetical protein